MRVPIKILKISKRIERIILQAATTSDDVSENDAQLLLFFCFIVLLNKPWKTVIQLILESNIFYHPKEKFMDTENTALSVISSDKVNGTNVYSPAAEKLGSIDSLMIDKISGRVRYAVMEFGGFLGMGTDRYPLPWDTLKYSTDLDGYVVSVTKDQLENAPRYPHGTVQNYDNEYGRSVNDYYGTPYI